MVARSPRNPMLVCVCMWNFGLTWLFVTSKVDGDQFMEVFSWGGLHQQDRHNITQPMSCVQQPRNKFENKASRCRGDPSPSDLNPKSGQLNTTHPLNNVTKFVVSAVC